MSKKKSLDFFVIGAQKAGTTSLHNHLKSHPKIVVPNGKEAPFFSNHSALKKGLEWYIKEFFPKASTAQLLGSVTPQYMAYPKVPEKMWQQCPDAKIIAILRDPVERARSHYKMRVRAFGEKRPYQQAVLEQLEPQALVESRKHPTPSNSFVTWGEYGRILTSYLSFFPRNQLLVIFLSDLERDPGKVMGSIYRFLGLKMMHANDPVKHYNIAQDKSHLSISVILANAIHNNKMLRQFGKQVVPSQIKRRMVFWSIVNRNNPKLTGDLDASLSDEVSSMLYRHYQTDLNRLDDIGVDSIPWRKQIVHESNTGANR